MTSEKSKTFFFNTVMQFVWKIVKNKDKHERELSFNSYC